MSLKSLSDYNHHDPFIDNHHDYNDVYMIKKGILNRRNKKESML